MLRIHKQCIQGHHILKDTHIFHRHMYHDQVLNIIFHHSDHMRNCHIHNILQKQSANRFRFFRKEKLDITLFILREKTGDEFPQKVTTCSRHYKPKLILPLWVVLLYHIPFTLKIHQMAEAMF